MPEQQKLSHDHPYVHTIDRIKKALRHEKRGVIHTPPSKEIVVQKKVIPPAKVIKNRPIEQVLVGAWNAIKPESQGKAIMKVYDTYIHPKYANEQERKKAAVIRPKIEKIVGWTALGTEAALITFGVVKGYQKLKSIDWNRFSHTRESKYSTKKRLLRVRRVGKTEAQIQFDMAMAAIKAEADMAPNNVYAKLFGGAIPADLKENLAPNFFKQVFAEVQKFEFCRQINEAAPVDQHTMMFEVTRRVLEDMRSTLKDEGATYLEDLRKWFIHVGFPGLEQYGVQWKSKI